MKYLKTYNESTDDFFPPKPKDELVKNFIKLDKEEMEETIYDSCVDYFDGDQDKFHQFVINELGVSKDEVEDRLYISTNGNFDEDYNVSDVLGILTKVELIKMFDIMMSK